MKSGFIVWGTILSVSFLGGVRSFAFQLAEKSGEVSLEQTAIGQTCETGAGARAQLDLGNGSVIRLGANSLLRSEEGGAPANLLNGTALFDFGKQSQTLRLKHAGKQISISGGTGFARFTQDEARPGNDLLIGALANKVSIEIDGKSLRLRPGQLLAFDTQAKPLVTYFNLAKLSENAALLKEFQSPLPSRATIQREVKNYVSLQKRGFIRSNKGMNTEQVMARRNLAPAEPGQLALATPNSTSVASVNSSVAATTFGAIRGISGGSLWQGGAMDLGGGGNSGNDATLTLSGGITVGGAGNVTVSQTGGGLSGFVTSVSAGLTKSGAGTLTLSAANTYSGVTTLSGGTLHLGTGVALAPSGGFTFAGGMLNANNRTDLNGALSLTASSTLNLNAGGGVGALTFTSASWTGGTLTINGWAGSQGSSDTIFITAGGSVILSGISFTGFGPGAIWLNPGDSTPTRSTPAPQPNP